MLNALFARAQQSRSWLAVLNQVLRFRIPFNAPHGIKVKALAQGAVTVTLPFKRANKNHVGGLHACALATACEFATGLVLLQQLGQSYRILMKSLQMEYFYQGRLDAVIDFRLEPGWVEREILSPLKATDSVLIEVSAHASDAAGNHLCTGKVSWHIKRWDRVSSAT